MQEKAFLRLASSNVIKAILINHGMAHWATIQVQNGEVAAFRGSD